MESFIPIQKSPMSWLYCVCRVDTNMGNATANIDNINRNNIDTSSTLLRVELFCLFILLARHIDPRMNCENYRQLIRDDEKGNGWVTRSVCTISLKTLQFFQTLKHKLI